MSFEDILWTNPIILKQGIIFQITLLSSGTLFQAWVNLQRGKIKLSHGGVIFFSSMPVQIISRGILFCFVLFCCFAWSYRNHSSVIKSNQITAGSHSLSLHQSRKLILLEVIVPSLMFMMSWLGLFTGALLWRACSPAVVKPRLSANPLCLSRRQQTDWSGLI